MWQELWNSNDATVPITSVILRLAVAAILGGVIGLEREWRERPAGLRTHVLVSLACATFALVTIEIAHLDELQTEGVKADPLHLVEAITSGVAFLAAGFIIFHKGEVQGVTTGAGMWLAASIGLAAGLGLHHIAALACVSGFAVLTVLHALEIKLNLKPDPEEESER